MIVVETQVPGGGAVQYFGVVDLVRKRYEGAQFDTDAFRAAAGTLPVDVSYAAHVQVTRVDPEVFVPPHPGDVARVARGEDLLRALCLELATELVREKRDSLLLRNGVEIRVF